jgi:D-aminoacyl-tRNA deacylase
MLLLFTSRNTASRNIAMKLIEEQGFLPDGPDRWKRGTHALLDTRAPTVLDVPADPEDIAPGDRGRDPRDFKMDCIIVLSTHKSRVREKIFTAHYPGNWSKAEMGGKERTLNVASPSRLKALFQEMKREADKIGWKCGLEADHHGPTGKIPIIFAEIGSTEEEWNDVEAAAAMARAISRAIERSEKYDSFMAVGGGHYPKQFEKLVLEGDLAIGHILPKYSIDGIDEDVFAQAIEKTTDKVVKVILLKEANLAQKEKIAILAKKHGLPLEMI